MYIMKYTSSDSFSKVLKENFIDSEWDMSELDLASHSENYANLA